MRGKQFFSPAILAGMAPILIGVGVIIEASRYSLGSLRQLGPGSFPVVLGALLIILGLTILVLEREREDLLSNVPIEWRNLVLTSAAVISFMATIERFGMFPAVFVSVWMASLMERGMPLLQRTILAAVVGTACIVIFVFGLGMPIAIVRI